MSKIELYNSQLIDELLQEISPEEQEKTEKRMLLAARIDDAIKAKGWRSKHLASALGKSASEISKWLSGTHNFTSDTLFDIERVLDVVLIKTDSEQAEVIKTFIYQVNLPVGKQQSNNFMDLTFGKVFNNTYSVEEQLN